MSQDLHSTRELKLLSKIAGHAPLSLVERLRVARPRRCGSLRNNRAPGPWFSGGCVPDFGPHCSEGKSRVRPLSTD